MNPKNPYPEIIVQLDKALDIVRSEWLKNKAKWAQRLDVLLSQRFDLMQKRDAHENGG